MTLMALSALCVSGCASQGPVTDDTVESARETRSEFEFYESTHESKSGIKQGASIRVDNPWGDVRVRNHRDARVKVTAAIQRIGDPRPAPPAIELTESVSGVSVTVTYEQATLEPRTGRVDLVVFIPEDKALEVTTRDGFIEIKKTRNRVIARSGSGQILALNEGPAELSSDSGEIHLRPITTGWGTLNARSGTGLIAAFLPQSENLSIMVERAGELEGEFELPRRDDRWHRQWGDGSDQVQLASRGPVKIYRVYLPPEDLAQEVK